jgi:hypothetical protein
MQQDETLIAILSLTEVVGFPRERKTHVVNKFSALLNGCKESIRVQVNDCPHENNLKWPVGQMLSKPTPLFFGLML